MRWLTRLTTAAVIAIAVVGIALVIRAKVPTTRVDGDFRTYALFRDGSRLAPGSAVVIAGVQVGVIEKLNREAGIALLDKIGPAILLTHSQSGAMGWPVADSRPNLVRGIIAVEPSGPPAHDLEMIGAPNWPSSRRLLTRLS